MSGRRARSCPVTASRGRSSSSSSNSRAAARATAESRAFTRPHEMRSPGLLALAVTLTMTTAAAAAGWSAPCTHNLSVEVTRGQHFENGSVRWAGVEYRGGEWHRAPDGSEWGCPCAVKACVRKCCPEGHVFDEGCRLHEEARAPLAHRLPVFNDTRRLNVSVDHFAVVPANFCKHGAYKLVLDDELDEHYVQSDGTLFLPAANGSRHLPHHYCLERFAEDGLRLTALVCFIDEENADHSRVVYSIGMLVSMPFLVATFAVYAAVPELRNLHGKSLMCYVATLLVAYAFLVSVQMGRDVISHAFCQCAGFVIYFSFMVSFLWLNVMCVDIWLTFSGRRGFGGAGRQSERRRFLAYSGYAWGVPALMLAVALALQFSPAVPAGTVRPQIGDSSCWFPDDRTVGLYFYWPLVTIIVVNVALFSWTTWRIYQVRRDTDKSMRHDSRRHGDDDDQQRYKLYLKLMFVFGVNWSMEIISWLASGPAWLWFVTDLCNALYGVFIFFVFLYKRTVWRLVHRRYLSLMGRPYRAKSYAPGSTRLTGLSTATSSAAAPDATSVSFHSSAQP